MGKTRVESESVIEQLEVDGIYSGEIQKNSSLYAELLLQEVPKTAVAAITDKFSELFDLTNSHPGDEYKLFLTHGDSLLAFEYTTRDLKKYRLEKNGKSYVEQVADVELERRIEYLGAVIETSLWAALIERLPDPELFAQITDIYDWEIDFLTESRSGDKFSMIYEAFYKDSVFVKCGDILAAEYDLAGVPHLAFQYTDPDGYTDYYDENGYSLKRALLKSPLNYRRISSQYSDNRIHPVLKIERPHLGVDYAAEIGTPVVAAGDGIVKVKDCVNGFGNYIEIEHDFGLTTGYGHLDSFAKGVVRDRRVRQGQIIGYVGQTGMATGPHLDYRVKKDGQYINPLHMTIPASPPVKNDFIVDYSSWVNGQMKFLNNHGKSELYVLNQ